MNILITSVGTATSVNLIRYFKKLGDKIFGTDINDYGYTAGSMMVDYYSKVSLATAETYIDEINNIIKMNGIDILIPVNDTEVAKISENINELKCKCVVPTIDIINRLRDKYICSSEMKELGISVPEILSEDNISIKRILRDRIGVGSKGIEILNKGEAVPPYSLDDKFLQEFVEGEEYTVDVLADLDGMPVYIVPRKRIEVKSGVATKVRIENDSELIGYVERILEFYRIPGFSNIQFFKEKDGGYKFVEINYRFSGCGAATLATSEGYLEKYKKIVDGEKITDSINSDTKWNSVVTRYYEEVVYEDSIS